MRSLGARLEAVASLIHEKGPFTRLADIGSDHAFLATRVLQNGDALHSVASDINPGPLERGRKNAEKSGVRPTFVLSDGFENLKEFDFDAACICGMGGEMIASILERYGAKDSLTYFLQPMTAQDDLRRFLWDNGYTILEECYVCEREKPYAILIARHTGTSEPYTYADLFLGKFRPENDKAFLAYAQKAFSQSQKRQKGLLARGEDPTEEQTLQDEITRITGT